VSASEDEEDDVMFLELNEHLEIKMTSIDFRFSDEIDLTLDPIDFLDTELE
jgi:hypothetical protein